MESEDEDQKRLLLQRLEKLPNEKRQTFHDIMNGRIRSNGNSNEPSSMSVGFNADDADRGQFVIPKPDMKIEQQLQEISVSGAEQDNGKGKRKRVTEVLRSARKRRGPLFPHRLNTGDQFALTQSGTLCPKPFETLASANTKLKQKCRAQASSEAKQLEEIMLRKEELVKEKDHFICENGKLRMQLELAQKQVEMIQTKFLRTQRSLASCREKLIEVLGHKAVTERKLREERLAKDQRQIGRIVPTQNSFGAQIDVWENGERFRDLNQEQIKLDEQMADLILKKKELYQLKKKLRKQAGASPSVHHATNTANPEFAHPRPLQSSFINGETHIGVQAEIYSLQTAHIKRKQTEFDQAQKDLILLKQQHIKSIKMMDSEKKSAYQGKLLNDRYLCTKLIGKGGFSEVWKAYDLDMHRDVACKIHALNEKWSDQKKENFTRHATREAQIQKGLSQHPRIVQLFDVFGIDANTFCTVLELCEGSDLDAYLNANSPLPEREARSIIIQLFEGLTFLAKQKKPIIHYDLKPGNLLYSNGKIKITDFGLSKIMQKDQHEIELTSPGAGTYWYLPPECFVSGNEPPMIGTGVDMWSGGCILFEMLYGQRPFANDMTEDSILSEGPLFPVQPGEVKFPASPKVSEEAKDLIRKCLARDHKDRPDPSTVLATHPYFSKLRPSRS